jgi:hypothetical protein
MTASSMTQAGVSHADIITLRAVRNSPVRDAPLYRKIRDRVRAQVNAYHARQLQNSYLTAA